MKRFILLAAVAMLAMPQVASADLLVGFENWIVNNPNGGAGVINAATITEPGFSGDSTTVTTGWGRSASGAHDDGTFGTLAGAETNVAFNRGLALNNGANGAYDFSITNGTADDYELEFFHFDTGTFRPNAAHEWTVSVQSGDLTAQSIESGSADNIAGGTVDWYDYDIDLSGLTGGNVLAAGETATFRLDLAGGTGASGHHQYVDNIAVSGSIVTVPVPEPSSLAILGLAGLGVFVRRRK
jgi:opacity protein-like surface antigen